MNQPVPTEIPGSKAPTKEYIFEGLMAPATYVAGDGLVRHQLEERPLVL